MCPASYNLCAVCIVLETLKPSFLAASCCIVEVVNGGAGFLRRGLFLILLTINSAFLNPSRKELKLSSSFVLMEYLALNFILLLLINSAVVLYEDTGLKFKISFSLSAINLKTTDWTLPADNPPLTFLQSIGEIL